MTVRFKVDVSLQSVLNDLDDYELATAASMALASFQSRMYKKRDGTGLKFQMVAAPVYAAIDELYKAGALVKS